MRLVFGKKHLLFFAALFLTEISIAVFVHDRFVRPFVGDVLVVLLMYAFVRTFFEVSNHTLLAGGLLLLAYLVELGQHFDLVSRLGFAESRVAALVIGTSFDWADMLAYTIGFVLIVFGRRVNSPAGTGPQKRR
ncbi:MAG: DUF2809 domain-containing protein [Chloroflexota bacterium]